MTGPQKLQPSPSAGEFVVAWQVLPVGLGALQATTHFYMLAIVCPETTLEGFLYSIRL